MSGYNVCDFFNFFEYLLFCFFIYLAKNIQKIILVCAKLWKLFKVIHDKS